MDPTPAAGQKPDPAIMRGAIPYLEMCGDAAAAIDFYARAFGARDVARIPLQDAPGALLHSHVEINGGSLMMTDDGCQSGRTRDIRGVTMQLILSDADGDLWWNRAVDAGCDVTVPLQTMFWGARYGRLRDPFGIEWAFNVEG